MSQTSYAPALAIAFAGMLADTSPHRIRSGVNQQAGGIPFGVGLVKSGVSDNSVALPGSNADKLVGVAVHTHAINTLGLAGATNPVATGDQVPVLEQGVVYVQVEEAVAANDPAYCRFAPNGGNTQKGAWRKSADNDAGSNPTALLVKGAYFRTSAGAGGFAELAFDVNAART